MSEHIRVVVGLGNPGREYEETRHNLGFRLLDRLARDLGAGEEQDQGHYRLAWATLGDYRIALLRPMAFMNRSGPTLARFPESVVAGPLGHLVVLDDVWLPLGAIRFRLGGGAGGHKGLNSVLEYFGTEAVPRLRLGVGGHSEEDLVDHVLHQFTDDEEKEIVSVLERACDGVRTFVTEGPDVAMSRFNSA